MTTIAERQNKPNNIEKLQAQRQLYSEIKWLMLVNLSIGVILPVVFTAISFILSNDTITAYLGIQKQDIGYMVAFISVTAAVCGEVASQHIKKMKEKAAKIQEDFDTNVFNINWDKINVGEKIEYRVIHEKSKAYIKKHYNDMSFNNWYTLKAAKLKYPKSIVFCQQQNLNWDNVLREKIVKVPTFFLIIIIFLVLILGLANDFSLRIIFTNVFLPLLPICLFFYKMITEQRGTILEMERLKDINKELIDSVISDSLAKSEIINRCRQLQTAIYMHRKSARPIPNWLHKRYKKEQEDESSKRMQRYIDEHQILND